MIQPLAYIHPQAKIADNVVIEPFVTIHNMLKLAGAPMVQIPYYGWRPDRQNCRIFRSCSSTATGSEI